MQKILICQYLQEVKMDKYNKRMDKVLIIGASDHAKVITEAIELNGNYKIYGVIDTCKSVGVKVLGYSVLGDEHLIPELINKGVTKGIIGIGDNWIRQKMMVKIREIAPDFEFITVIHPKAVVSPYAKIGKGTVVLAMSVVNTEAIVGDFCIINTNAILEHNCVIGDFASIASGGIIGGKVQVGGFSLISLGANVIQSMTIGEHSIVGAGAVVTSSVASYKVSSGVPSRPIKDRKEGERYLTSAVKDISFECRTIKSQEDINLYKKNLESLNNQNPFYILELLDTTDMKGYELRYFVLKTKSAILMLMPFYIRSIEIDGEKTPYYDVTSPYGYGGPLYNKQKCTDKMILHFWEKVDQWYKNNAIVSEFIRFSLNDNHKEYTGECIPSLVNIKGEITDFEKTWVSFKPKVRNNYRKAQQEELSLKLYSGDISRDVIKDFYDIYIQTMQRNNADDHYFHFIDYFITLVQNNPSGILIAMVYKNNIPISTELILLGEGVLYSYLGGTISDYFYTRPNDFLKIEVMKWAQENEFKYYVLGGGRKNGDSLYKYKKSFFPNDEDVVYYTGRKVIDKEVYCALSNQKKNQEIMGSTIDVKTDYFPIYRKNESAS